MLKQLAFGICILLSTSAFAGNETNDSFSQAKKYLKQIYADHRETIYCGAKFNTDNTVILPDGFATTKHKKTAITVLVVRPPIFKILPFIFTL